MLQGAESPQNDDFGEFKRTLEFVYCALAWLGLLYVCFRWFQWIGDLSSKIKTMTMTMIMMVGPVQYMNSVLVALSYQQRF